MDQSQLRTAWFKALIGPQDSKIGEKMATLLYMQPENTLFQEMEF